MLRRAFIYDSLDCSDVLREKNEQVKSTGMKGRLLNS